MHHDRDARIPKQADLICLALTDMELGWNTISIQTLKPLWDMEGRNSLMPTEITQ